MIYPEVGEKSGFEETNARELANETPLGDHNSNTRGAEVRRSEMDAFIVSFACHTR
jgi:hypothetical protein